MLVKYFKDRFSKSDPKSFKSILENLSTLPIPKLNQQQVDHIDRPISNYEMELVVFQLESHKAPGLDGIPAFSIKSIR